ncbi:MAG: CoA transferase [Caulobacterales bacterium]|nr:CoA transferase [Caulobacterales bacterium]
MSAAAGPLSGLKVLEFSSVGPLPYCGMLLADLGADVVRIDRPGARGGAPFEIISRGRRSIVLDLKDPAQLKVCVQLIERADAILEGYRPGFMERIGLGPEAMLARNPRLAYGRLSGFGQDGPMSQAVGHDINFIALSGALGAIGTEERPTPPLNLVGGTGGALFLAFGVVCALLHAQRTERGQVVDTAMSEAATSLMSAFLMFHAAGDHNAPRGANMGDGGAHFYNAYRCADGHYIAVGAIEPDYYAAFLEPAGIKDPEFAHQQDPARWPGLKRKLADIIATRSRADWLAAFEGADTCVTPVLELDEIPGHPQVLARGGFVEVAGVRQPAPTPRFSETPGQVQGPPPTPGRHAAETLADWGLQAGVGAAQNPA